MYSRYVAYSKGHKNRGLDHHLQEAIPGLQVNARWITFTKVTASDAVPCRCAWKWPTMLSFVIRVVLGRPHAGLHWWRHPGLVQHDAHRRDLHLPHPQDQNGENRSPCMYQKHSHMPVSWRTAVLLVCLVCTLETITQKALLLRFGTNIKKVTIVQKLWNVLSACWHGIHDIRMWQKLSLSKSCVFYAHFKCFEISRSLVYMLFCVCAGCFDSVFSVEKCVGYCGVRCILKSLWPLWCKKVLCVYIVVTRWSLWCKKVFCIKVFVARCSVWCKNVFCVEVFVTRCSVWCRKVFCVEVFVSRCSVWCRCFVLKSLWPGVLCGVERCFVLKCLWPGVLCDVGVLCWSVCDQVFSECTDDRTALG